MSTRTETSPRENPYAAAAHAAKVARFVASILASARSLAEIEATATAIASASPVGAAFADALSAKLGEHKMSLTTRADVARRLELHVEMVKRLGADRDGTAASRRLRAVALLDRLRGADVAVVAATIRAMGDVALAEAVQFEDEVQRSYGEERDDGE
jgi:prophage DNA circulation protein